MKPHPVGNVTHGLRSAYAHGCRCARCREAEKLYKRDLRARQRARRREAA